MGERGVFVFGGGKKFWALSALQGAPMRCCGDSLLLVVPRHHPFEGCEGTQHVREHSNASSALEGRYKCW